MPYKSPETKKEHHKRYMKEVWYPKNKVKHIGYQTKIKAKIAQYIKEHKRKNKCLDCGFSGLEYPEVMDFDHVYGKKSFELSSFHYYTNSMKVVQKEIQKCEVVCANCHRIRTASRKTKKIV